MLYVQPLNKGFIIPPFLHFLVFWPLVFETHLTSYQLHNTRVKDINVTAVKLNISAKVGY